MMKFYQDARALIIPATIMLALAACSQSPDGNAPAASNDGAGKSATASNGVPAIKPVDIPTKGGDGSPIELTALSDKDRASAKMKGALGCNFAPNAEAEPILVAMGDTASKEPSRGIVKVGESIETIAANGGYDAMAKGTKFYAKGLELRVAPIGPSQGDEESPPRPATLTADRADGARRVFAGLWQCGT